MLERAGLLVCWCDGIRYKHDADGSWAAACCAGACPCSDGVLPLGAAPFKLTLPSTAPRVEPCSLLGAKLASDSIFFQQHTGTQVSLGTCGKAAQHFLIQDYSICDRRQLRTRLCPWSASAASSETVASL